MARSAVDRLTIHNVRNFNYRTETDFDSHWETRSYDLSKLDSADLIAVYWAGKPIAHIMLSFGFSGKDYLAVSTRDSEGEGRSVFHAGRLFSAVRALLRRGG